MISEPSPRQLDEALGRRGAGVPLAEAVGAHPAAEELESILRLTERMDGLGPPAAADTATRARARSEFVRAGETHRLDWIHLRPVKVRKPGRHPLPSHRLRLTMVVGVALLFALVAGVTLALATQLALPDSPLYGFKQRTENLLVTVNRTPTTRAAVRIEIGTQRFRDAEAMAAKGDGPRTVGAMKAYFEDLRLAGNELSGAPRTAAWKSVRGQFQQAESKPIDVVVSQLQTSGLKAAAAEVLALEVQFAKDRAVIDARLKDTRPGQPNGTNPSPLPGGAQPSGSTP